MGGPFLRRKNRMRSYRPRASDARHPIEPAGARILLRLDRGDALLIAVALDDLEALELAASAALNAAQGVLAILSRGPEK